MSNLTYMAALAVSATTRDKVFELTIEQAFKTVVYFRQVYMLSKKLGFDYARAFQLAAKRAGAETVKAFLLRFASAIRSGESELEFLQQEARVQREVYTSQYLRQLDSLQKWTDAYAALLVSACVIVVVAMVSTMLYDMGKAFVTLLSAMTIVMTIFGAYVIYRSAPTEVTSYKSHKGPTARRLAMLALVLALPLAAAMAYFALPKWGLGGVFLALGVALVPSGIFAYLDDRTVNRLDQEIATFVRALGNVAAAVGSTLSGALPKLDRRSLGTLEAYVRRLQIRLQNQIRTDVCWEKFRDEAGSELVNRTTRMFVDGVNLGGSADQVGEVASNYAMSVAMLRAKRQGVASTFAYLSFPLHGAMVGLLTFILEVVKAFNAHLAEVTTELTRQAGGASVVQIPSLPVFQTRDLGHIEMVTLAVIVGFTIVNSLAPKFATGGHNLKIVFFASVMCILSGLTLIFLPPVARKVLF